MRKTVKAILRLHNRAMKSKSLIKKFIIIYKKSDQYNGESDEDLKELVIKKMRTMDRISGVGEKIVKLA